MEQRFGAYHACWQVIHPIAHIAVLTRAVPPAAFEHILMFQIGPMRVAPQHVSLSDCAILPRLDL